MAKDADGTKVLLGRGKLYFDRFDSAGAKTGERFLGNSTEIAITPSEERRQMFSSAEKSSPLLADSLIRRTYEVRAVLTEYTVENLALVLAGDAGTLSQSAAPGIIDEAISGVKQGRFYKLLNRSVSAVVVTDTVPTTFTVTTDYEVDAVTGRIYIVPGGGIADGTDLLVDYDAAAVSKSQVAAGLAGNVQGFLRYIADPVNGPTHELEIWKVNMAPDGAVGFLGDDYGDFPLKGTILTDAVNHPNEPLFRLIEL